MFFGGIRYNYSDLRRTERPSESWSHIRVSSTAAPVMEDALIRSFILQSPFLDSVLPSHLLLCVLNVRCSERQWKMDPNLDLSGLVVAVCISEWKQKAVPSHVICWTAQVSSEARPALEASTDWLMRLSNFSAYGRSDCRPFFIFHVGLSSFHCSFSEFDSRCWQQRQLHKSCSHPHTPLTFQMLNNLFACVCEGGWVIFSLLLKKVP